METAALDDGLRCFQAVKWTHGIPGNASLLSLLLAQVPCGYMVFWDRDLPTVQPTSSRHEPQIQLPAMAAETGRSYSACLRNSGKSCRLIGSS